MTWEPIGRMRAALADLIRPLAIDRLGRMGVGVKAVPLVVRGADGEFAGGQDEGAPQFESGQVLADAVLGPEFKGSIRALERMQVVVAGVRGGGEPAIGQELVGPFPVRRVAVQGLMDDPDEGAAGRIFPALGVDDVDARRAFAQRRRRREEPEGFFDHGMRVWDLVEQMRGLHNGGGDGGEIGTEYRVVFGPDASHALRVGRQEVVAVA